MALKREIRVMLIEFSVIKNRKEEALVPNLGVVICSCLITDVLAARMAVDKLINAKHQGYIVRAKVCALRNERIKAVQWTRIEETQCGSKTIIRSLTDRDGH